MDGSSDDSFSRFVSRARAPRPAPPARHSGLVGRQDAGWRERIMKPRAVGKHRTMLIGSREAGEQPRAAADAPAVALAAGDRVVVAANRPSVIGFDDEEVDRSIR